MKFSQSQKAPETWSISLTYTLEHWRNGNLSNRMTSGVKVHLTHFWVWVFVFVQELTAKTNNREITGKLVRSASEDMAFRYWSKKQWVIRLQRSQSPCPLHLCRAEASVDNVVNFTLRLTCCYINWRAVENDFGRKQKVNCSSEAHVELCIKSNSKRKRGKVQTYVHVINI